MAGIFYGWIGIYYGGLAQMSDTWSYQNGSIFEYHLLLNHPYDYFTNLFRDPYNDGFTKFFETSDSYWNDLKGNFFIKILSLFNLLSFGNYYINVIFYSFLTLFGPMAFYRVMNDVYPDKKKIILISTFLIPSFLYWTSGLHKEGLIFLGLSLIIYVIYFAAKEKKISFKRIFGLLAGILLVLALRNYIIIILLPALLTYFLVNRRPRYGLLIFCSLYIIFGVAFFTVRYINPRFDFPQAVVNKQQEFIKLQGNSTIPIEKLKPTAISFLENMPQAINLSSIRPYPSDVRHILSLAAAIEINTLLLLFGLFLFFRVKKATSNNIIYFCIFFSFTLLLAIGFSVNNLGAIVRYRSIILPFLLVPMTAQINWNKIFKLFSNNIKK
jgi:hypothetical protein